MPGGQQLELGHERGVAAQRQVGVHPILDRAEPKLLQALGLRSRPRLIGDLGVGHATPQSESVAQQRRRPGLIARGSRLAAGLDGGFELGGIGVPRLEGVAGRPCDQDVLDSGIAQHAAQARQVGVEGPRGRRRRLSAPELVDQAVPRDDSPGVDEQERQQRALTPAGDRDEAVARVGL